MTVTRPQAHRPVPRRRTALASALALLVLLTGMLWLVGLLRHPFPDGGAVLPPQAADPREEVVCPDPQPLEGGERDEARAAPGQPATEITSNDLYDCPETWHGRRVRYRGEAVGAVLHRRGGAWVQLNDDAYAGDAGPLPAHRDFRGGNAGVGVLLPTGVAERIEHVGGPQWHGDTVEVVGTFQRIEPVSREVAVIVADSGEIVAPGSPIARPLLGDRAVAAVVLALLAAGLVVAERVAVRRSR